jgi:hypothetical protein
MSSFSRKTNDKNGPRFQNGHGQKRKKNCFTPRKAVLARQRRANERAALEQELLDASTAQTKQQRIDAVMASSFSMTFDVAEKVVARHDKLVLRQVAFSASGQPPKPKRGGPRVHALAGLPLFNQEESNRFFPVAPLVSPPASPLPDTRKYYPACAGPNGWNF